jgi:hypothetical protein
MSRNLLLSVALVPIAMTLALTGCSGGAPTPSPTGSGSASPSAEANPLGGVDPDEVATPACPSFNSTAAAEPGPQFPESHEVDASQLDLPAAIAALGTPVCAFRAEGLDLDNVPYVKYAVYFGPAITEAQVVAAADAATDDDLGDWSKTEGYGVPSIVDPAVTGWFVGLWQ